MYQVQFSAASTEEFYEKLQNNAQFLFNLEQDWLANLSNAAAMIGLNMDRINWVGFYLWRREQLILGPFWGKPACTRIEIGKGVCGTAVATMQAQLVENVADFPGHIACDAASQSELVIPFTAPDGRLLGVLDIDSPELSRFNRKDICGMNRFIEILVSASEWPEVLL